MLDPDLAARKAICYESLWRGLPEGTDHPRHYVRLTQREVAELVATGGFTLPDSVIPESVRAWRKTQESIAEIVTSENPPLTADALREAAHV